MISAEHLFSFGMEDAHDTEDIVAGLPVDDEIIPAADILKQGGVDWPADRGRMDLHLDPADILKLAGTDEPFGTFTVTF
jgi:hypothetical protein